jgi:hypothetical protein
VEEYIYLTEAMQRNIPDILFSSSAFLSSLSVAISALSLVNGRIVRASLDLFITLLNDANFKVPASPVREAVVREGYNLTAAIVSGIVADFEDSAPAIALARILADQLPTEFAAWVPPAVSAVSPKALAGPVREQFISSFLRSVWLA